MTDQKRTVLITGCSAGGLGAALALAFRQRGLRVFATVRDLDKAQALRAAGVECLRLDVLDSAFIASCVERVTSLTGGKLDILINNAGRGHYQPFMHLDIPKAKQVFDLNVWSYLEVTQAFLPLLMKAASPAKSGPKAILVNNTSISSVLRTPFQDAYSASKAAMAMFNDIQRIELAPFGIKVADLKTGSLTSNFGNNMTSPLRLPEGSPYKLIEKEAENVINGTMTEGMAESQENWAKNVVKDLLKNEKNPPAQIWRGGMAGTMRIISTVMPTGMGDKSFREMGGLDKMEKILAEKGTNSST